MRERGERGGGGCGGWGGIESEIQTLGSTQLGLSPLSEKLS